MVELSLLSTALYMNLREADASAQPTLDDHSPRLQPLRDSEPEAPSQATSEFLTHRLFIV